jgi:hypothetical protein
MNLIITENYLKENGIINGNADMKIITPTLSLVQDKYIEPLLGTKLFDAIVSQIGSSSVTPENQTLLNNYVLPCMLWYTLCEVTPMFKYRYMNKGVMVKNSENSEAASLQEIQYLMDQWKNNGEMYAERTTKFLKRYATSTVYTLYLDNNECDEIKPNKTNYTSGIYVGDDNDECNNYYS